MNSPLLQLHNISKNFTSPAGSTISILDNISLKILQNQSIAITGESGSGKSTAINIIGGLESQSSGNVFWENICIDNFSVSKKARLRRNFIGFIFQSANLIPELTVLENVTLPIRIIGENIKKYIPVAQNLLNRLNISHLHNQIPKNLSGGERQRAAIARALISNPKLIIADEPTGNLDEENASNVIELLLELCRQNQSSLLLVTHNTEFAKIMDSHFLLKNKTLIQEK